MAAPPKAGINFNRAQVVDQNMVRFLKEAQAPDGVAPRPPDEAVRPASRLTCRDARELLESQFIARHQDVESREMRARLEGFYTIGSTGHEGNAMVGRLTRPTDMAFLHYRSGAFLAERARQVPGQDFVRDTMLSFAASSDDPISGGRHKVWGSVPMNVPPQTSTIASHLPKALGAAFFLKRASRLGTTHLPDDSIIVCSFGDASTNHAVAQTAFNAAGWLAHQKMPAPVLFLCEDNGIGISVHSPVGWVEANMRARHGIAYFQADGLDIAEGYDTVAEAVAHCRDRRCPVFLHMKTVRLLGHAGTDAEYEYHSWEQIETTEARDPLLQTARRIIDEGILSPGEVLDLYESIRARVRDAAKAAAKAPRLTTREQVTWSLAPFTPDKVMEEARRAPDASARQRAHGETLPEASGPKHMAVLINQGLHDLMIKYPESALFGEDVARKGGVYHVTTGLEAKFGVGRVFNTLLDETMILAMAIGAGHLGLLPLPEIQYVAYVHNAEDQIRGEACSLQFFSNRQYRNPMVVRVQGWAYQKGFGGHFHNDNSITVLRDIPGLVVATPSRGDDAVAMMRTLLAMAKVDGRVCVMVEPIALYMTKDLHAPKDGLWQFPYPAPGEAVPFGEGRVYDDDAKDITIISFANGLWMSLRAAKELREKHNIHCRVVDLRWLVPLNEEFIAEQAAKTGRVLIMDESRRSGGIAEAIMAVLVERCPKTLKARRINAVDTYVPLGPATDCVLPLERDIVREAIELMK